jgi:hypothetical protein
MVLDHLQLILISVVNGELPSTFSPFGTVSHPRTRSYTLTEFAKV